jgi:hypothetical protein
MISWNIHLKYILWKEERDGKNHIITIDADPDDIKNLQKKKRDILQIEEVKPKQKKQSEKKQSKRRCF